jgi:hypothetical protein
MFPVAYHYIMRFHKVVCEMSKACFEQVQQCCLGLLNFSLAMCVACRVMHVRGVQVAMVGAVGQDYVHRVLSTYDPKSAIEMVHKRGALTSPNCKPLLGLLDQLGVTRCDSHAVAPPGKPGVPPKLPT